MKGVVTYLLRQLKNILIIGMITFALLEVTLRLFGVEPFRVRRFEIQSSPKFCLIPNEQYGFGLNPGAFDITINKGVSYHTTHSADSLRILTYEPIEHVHKTVDIHGCSFTYGMSVDDSLAFPFLLQQGFSDIRFRSFAVPGFGNIQALIRLQEQLNKEDLPDTLILCYADFHDERNVLNANYRKSLYHGFLNANADVLPLFAEGKVPFYDAEKGIQYCSWNELYDNWRGRTYCAVINSFQNTVEKIQFRQGKVETHQILLRLHHLCRQQKVHLIIATITKSESTEQTIEYCKQEGIEVIDIGLDLSNAEFSSLPYDTHPNKKAHQVFEARLRSLFIQ